ncbi:titin-like [Tribolium madens]|uniref:titin-like n=1 Tax=Tribolium madens TaxID=41895 RepID=UPI001CF725DA|nr:titin-like [Tribolium madens]
MFKFLVWHVLLLGVSCELFNHELGYRVEYAPTYDNYKPRDYHFSYAVSDPHTGDHKSQWEVKENGVVRGAYSLLEPDGTTRIVEYIADHDGFRAVVKKIGTAIHPEPVITVPEQIVPEVAHFRSYDGQIYNYANSAPLVLHSGHQTVQEVPEIVPELRPVEAVPHPTIEEHRPVLTHIHLPQPQIEVEPARSFVQVHHPTEIPKHEVPEPEIRPIEAVPLFQHEIRVPELSQHDIRPNEVPIAQQYGKVEAIPLHQHEIRVPEVPHHEIRPILQEPISQHYGKYEAVSLPQHEIRVPHYEIKPLLQVPIPHQYGCGQAVPLPQHGIRTIEQYAQAPHYGRVEAVPLPYHEIRVPEVPLAHQEVELGHRRVEEIPQHGNEIGQGQVPLEPVGPSYKTTIVYGLTGNPEDDSRYSQPEEKYHASYSEKVPKLVPAPSKTHSDHKRESPTKEEFLIIFPDRSN